MKLLSVVVPCYNSQEYMHIAIESLLAGNHDVEIILVNDGSTDKTAEIADQYAENYPDQIQVIHQENGGHGEAINAGLAQASGKYFKVVDSDDWVDTRAYDKVMRTIKELVKQHTLVDLIINNFVYEKEGAKKKKVMKYDTVMPAEKVISWDEVKPFKKAQYIMMHSIIYRTNLLKESKLSLPKHTFYVDNLYVYEPLPFVQSLYYLDVDFYRYLIGREDQSVNEEVMIRRIDQQIKVNKMMIEAVNLDKIDSYSLKDYMLKHLEIVTVISSILLIKSGKKENLEKKKELMQYIKKKNTPLYVNLKFGLLGRLINLPTRLGRGVSVGIYKVSQKVIGFN